MITRHAKEEWNITEAKENWSGLKFLFLIFPFLHFSSSHSIYRSNTISYTYNVNKYNNKLILYSQFIINHHTIETKKNWFKLKFLLLIYYFLQPLPFPSLVSSNYRKGNRRSVNERETSLTMVDLPLLVISRATCGIRIEDAISFAWPADHVNSISTGYNGFSSCVYRFEGEHDEIVKLRFNKLLNGNRTCRSVSSADFNRLLCVGSENFFVKVSLIVPFQSIPFFACKLISD